MRASRYREGVIAIAGSAPIEINPFAIGPRSAPVSVNVDRQRRRSERVRCVARQQHQAGRHDRRIDLGISGTVAQPQITGQFSISKGCYVSDLSRTPITGIEAQIAFNRSSASVDKLQGNFGSGTIVGLGYTSRSVPTRRIS